MQCELKELNMNMGKLEYEMYQDIPVKESGSTNLCNGLPYEVFKNYLESQMARKYQITSYYDTKVITYIMYVNGLPVGYIGLRFDIDDNWRKWSGNFYYAMGLCTGDVVFLAILLMAILALGRLLKIMTVFS